MQTPAPHNPAVSMRAPLLLSLCLCWGLATRAAFAFTQIAGLSPSRRGVQLLHCVAQPADQSDYVREQLRAKQVAYEQKRKADASAAVKKEGVEFPSLSSLPMLPYLTEAGLTTDVMDGAPSGVKASAYAVFDSDQRLVYVGASRGVQQSLRLHLARCPELTYGIKVYHITKPSRTLLGLIMDAWMDEEGGAPIGNDGGPGQDRWENPMNVMPLMTDQDRADLESAREKGREDGAIKKIARRFEAEKVAVLESRGVTENMRFDPKLKGKGLLDLWQPGPDTAVPT
jgi:hypothetical protein